MTNDNKKFLTEKVLENECWHEWRNDEEELDRQCHKCKSWQTRVGVNRTFTTEADMMDLFRAINKAGKWDAFDNFTWERRSGKRPSVAHTAWLFLRSTPEEFEAACQMVCDFIRTQS